MFLALDGEGLRFVNSGTGSASALSYGVPTTRAIEAVSTVLGPVTERDRNLERSALGIEFMAGGLQGILESEAPTARISDLWSGVNGVAR